MKVELKNVHFSESLSEETNAFTANVYVNGKKCGYAKNDGCGGCTDIRQLGGVNSKLFVECVNYLKTQPQINIGSEKEPYMVDCDMETMVDHLFELWLKDRDMKKLEKNMKNCLMWGVPYDVTYHYVKFKVKLSDIPHDILQNKINHYKKDFKDGEVFLNTNLVGFDL